MNHITVTLSFPRPMRGGNPADHLLVELLERLDKESHESMRKRLEAAVPPGVYVGVDPEKEARRFIRSLKRYAARASWYYDNEKVWVGMERYSWSVEIRGHGFPHVEALRFFWQDLFEVIGPISEDILLMIDDQGSSPDGVAAVRVWRGPGRELKVWSAWADFYKAGAK